MADTEVVEKVEETEAIAETPKMKEPETKEEAEPKVESEEEAPKAAENGGSEHEDSVEGEQEKEKTEPEKSEVEMENGEQETEKSVEEKVEEKTEKSLEENVEEEKEKTAEEKVEEKEKSGEEKEKSGEEKEKSETEPGKETEEDSHGATVAKHYNENPSNTKEERKSSRIFFLRNFNNWVKSVLINETIEKIRKKRSGEISVLDLCCGKGGDLLKWQKGKVDNLVCTDIADVSMKQCEQRYRDMQKNRHSRRYLEPLYEVQFITADSSKEELLEKYDEKNKKGMFDMSSCQFAFHYSFETQEQAERMLQNACEKLRPGGYFIGTIPCAYELVRRVREADDLTFGNDVYSVKFSDKEQFALFGHKYDFHLDSVVDCPEFLVNFPLLEKMAEKYEMKLEVSMCFQDYFNEHVEQYKNLLYRMQALETYPPRRDNDKLSSSQEDAYSAAKDFVDGAKAGSKEETSPKYRDHRNKSAHHVGTLSKDEWEAAGLYMVFAFKKAEPEPPAKEEKMEEDEDKTEGEWVVIESADIKELEVGDKTEDTKEEGTGEEGQETTEEKKEETTEVKVKEASDDVEKTETSEVKETVKDEIKDEAAEAKKEETVEDKVEETVEDKDEETVEDKKETEEEGKEEAVEMEDEAIEGSGERKVATPQRGTRSRRSVGSTEETKDDETKPKRETRKRKSTGGDSASADDEPPEKKKA